MVSTRREAAGARGEEERDGSEDESDEDDAVPWTDKELRMCAIELYAVAKGLGIEAVTCRTVLEHVGLPSHDNAQSAVRKAVRKICDESCPLDKLAETFWADWMNDFIHASLDEARAGGPAPGASESEENAREREQKAQSGARLYLDKLESGEPMTHADACEKCGLDRDSPADVSFLGKRARVLVKERAAQNVGAEDGPASPPLGANRIGRTGRRRKQLAPDAAPAEQRTLFGQKGVTKEEWDALVCGAAAEVAERMKGREDEYGARTELSRQMQTRLLDEHDCHVSSRTISDRSKQPEEARDRHGGRYFTPEFERQVTATIKFIRAHKGAVFKDDVIEWAFQENTRRGGKPIPRETLSSGWYYKFLVRNKLGTGDEKPVETDRAKWVTPPNTKQCSLLRTNWR
mmetsp:Transcript_14093/g.59392  ORF Transcript_14093/g.59392 Transcript_14093/m.59392 type:complete len:404 (-) Transcript_14093:2385-3596(-)